MSTILKIAGSDALAGIKAACDLVLNGTTDVADINAFLADKTVGIYTLNIYRTIYVTGNLTKKINHNWQGKCGVIKMMPGLTTLQYIAGLIPEPGDHNYTYVNDLELDGNELNNPDVAAGGIYCHGLSYETFDDITNYTSETFAINVKIKNIHSHGWVRSCVLPGSGWICRNIRVGNSRLDHLLYVSGVQNVNVNKLYLYGYSNGALHISGATYWLNPTSPENIKIKDVVFSDCVVGVTTPTMLHIRSGFVGSHNSRSLPVKNLTIDGLKIRNTLNYAGCVLMVGTQTDDGSAQLRCENISILNVDADILLYSLWMSNLIRVKNLKISGSFKIRGNYTVRPFFFVYGGGFDRNDYDFSGCSFEAENYDTNTTETAVFGIWGDDDVIGLNTENVSIVNANVIRRMDELSAKIVDFKTTDLVYDKELNPDAITIT